MSGHSKWHNIQARKGKQDAVKSNVFSKYAKQITMATKQGGADVATNFSLRLLVEKSKAAGMPKDNIDRAIKRGTGELNDGAQMEEVLYEAYGPGGVAIMIKAITDNRNRTTSDIKHIISECGGTFGNSGSVAWMFEQRGVVSISNEQLTINKVSRDDLEMKLIEAGAEDIWDEEESVCAKFKVVDFKKIMDAVKSINLEPSKSGIEWIAKDKVKISAEDEERLGKLFSELEENDDADDYWTNAE